MRTADLPLVFTDSLGGPAWGAPNFKPMLEATGFKQFHTNGEGSAGSGVAGASPCALSGAATVAVVVDAAQRLSAHS